MSRARAKLAEVVTAAAADDSIDAFAGRDAQPDERAPRRWHRATELGQFLAVAATLPWVSLRIGDGNGDEIARLPVGGVVVLTAASGAGKSSLALDLAIRHALDIGPVVYLSRELDAAEIAGRIVGNRRGLSWEEALRAGDTPDAANALAMPRLAVLSDDGPGLEDTQAAIAAMAGEFPGEPIMVVADYVQILAGDGRDERARVANIAEALRRFAKAHRVLVIAISQTSRNASVQLRKGEMVGADTATSGAESAQIERGAYVTIAIGEAHAREDGTTDVAMSIGKGRFGGGDRVIPCSFDGRTGRWRVTGTAVSGAEHKAARDAAAADRAIDEASLMIRTALADGPEPMTRADLATRLRRRPAVVGAAVAALLAAGSIVEVRPKVGRKGRGWPVWTADKAAAAGLEVVPDASPGAGR